ncbi:hypothetical protein [Pseudomonas massiliensis]|uniref:hypothetical protein n=1 Tax=Pseudomonas massiliensis TaxID=522492 RepID=UPI00058C52B3|nr:hypothetical protein [Pseudomonas massiliensis]
MSGPWPTVAGLKLPDYLEDKCQSLLEDIQRADTMTNALLAEQRAVGFTEALKLLQVMPVARIERLYELYERALTRRTAELGLDRQGYG